MAKRIAFTFSGGGAKCVFQAGAERYLREDRGIRPCKVSCASGGAFNGMKVASSDPETLIPYWLALNNQKVTGVKHLSTNATLVRAVKRALRKKPAIYDNDGLWNIVRTGLDLSKLVIPLTVGVVGSRDGRYHSISSDHPGFTSAIVATSALMPAFPPVDVHPEDDLIGMIDAGVRFPLPIEDVVDAKPDIVIAFSANPTGAPSTSAVPQNILHSLQRGLDIAMWGLFDMCIQLFRAKHPGIQLVVIDPDARLGDVLDFRKETLEKNLKAGYEKARQVLQHVDLG